MKNRNVLILGMIGSGKTTLARSLLAETPRAVVLDRLYDYSEDGEVFSDFERSAEFFFAHEDGAPFKLVFQSTNEEAFEAWLTLLFEAQKEGLPPVGLFIEEASLYSDSHKLEGGLLKVYTMGRHFRINVVSVAQRDTQVNTLVRANSHVVATLRQKNLSTDIRDRFTRDELDAIATLETLTPGTVPELGVRYITDQGELDIVEYWAGAFDGADPAPPKSAPPEGSDPVADDPPNR